MTAQYLRKALVATMLTCFACQSFQARATVFELGEFSSPGSISFAGFGLLDPFEHLYHFSIAPGASLLVTPAVTTGYSERVFILDMEADLLGSGGVLQHGDAVTVYYPGTNHPSRDISFTPQLLDTGDYGLRIWGTPTNGREFLASEYFGSLAFEATAVPEPSSIVLVATGLLMMAWLAARRRINVRQHIA